VRYDRAVRELVRGAIRLHILHHAAVGAVNGAWMAAELARHGYAISPGTLYPTLHRMEAEGLLRSTRTVAGGRSRREYVVTAKGRRALEDGRRTLRELAREVLDEAAQADRPARRSRGR
jgi:DNA-binding PadR family transcriptional regulator